MTLTIEQQRENITNQHQHDTNTPFTEELIRMRNVAAVRFAHFNLLLDRRVVQRRNEVPLSKKIGLLEACSKELL